MKKKESGFAGGVLGFYVGVMLGLALFRMPLAHDAMNMPARSPAAASAHVHQVPHPAAASQPALLSPAAFGG